MQSNRSMPSATVIPILVYEDVPEAIEWLCDTFGFEEQIKIAEQRSVLRIGDGAVIVTGRRVPDPERGGDPVVLRPPRRGEVSHTIMVRVPDVDAHYGHARRSGARILQPPTDHNYGERQYAAEDLEGHRWSFSQSIADRAPEDWGGKLVHPG
jgi:uncharacterized glyoxalase superfamily protein PhnB